MTDNLRYPQLLVCEFDEGRIVRRLHLRFAAGDESFSYFGGGGLFIGPFREGNGAEAQAFVSRHERALAPHLTTTTPETSGLRPEDTGAAMAALISGKGFVAPPTVSAPARGLLVATCSAGGDTRIGVFAGKDEPPAASALREEWVPFADRVTGAEAIEAAKRGSSTTPAPKKRPWWRFW